MKSLEDNLFLAECLRGKNTMCEGGGKGYCTKCFLAFFFIDHCKNVNVLYF